MFCEDILDSIGGTPLVRLNPSDERKGRLFAKLELLNPFGMKDRVAKCILLKAKQTGKLKEGSPIIESSSGTMACGVALVGTYLGHEVHIVTDPRIDDITLAKLEALGCQVHIVDQMGSQGWQSSRLELLHQLLKRFPGAYWPQQYENPDNPYAYEELAAELIRDIHKVDVLVASVGSGGSLSGTARALKRWNPHIKVVAVDATGSVIFGQPDRPGRLQGGLGNSMVAPNMDHGLVDEIHWLNDQEAFAATMQLARDEKIFAGNSSGSVYVVAKWISTQVEPETNIVAVFPDRGDRYVQTIYSEQFRKRNEIHPSQLQFRPRKVTHGTVVSDWSYASLEGVYTCE